MLKKMLEAKKALSVAALSGSALISTHASAALGTGVTDAMTATTADVVEAGGLLIGLAVIGLGLRWVKGMFF